MSQATIPDLPFSGSPLPDTVLFEISNSGVSQSTDLATVIFNLENIQNKDQPNGYAGLDGSGLLSISQIPDLSGTYQILTEKDVANGYAGLDATGLLLLGTIPELPQSRTTDLISDLAARELLANKVTTIGTPGDDTNYPTEKATRDALDLKQDTLAFTPEDVANKVITVGTPGNDTNYPSEKAVRDALDLKEDSLGFTPENIVNKVTTVGNPGDDTNYPSEQAVREALDLKEDSLGFTPEDVANKSINLLTPDDTKYPTTLAITTELSLFQLLAGKGAVSGYAGLDASQELLLANFPTGTALQVLRRNAGNTALEFADVAAGGSQTPWTSNIDGAGFALLDTNYVEAGSVLATPFASIGHIRLPAEGSIAWRNDADDGDFQIYSTSDELTIEGWQTIVIPTAAVDIDLGNANVTGIETLELNGGGSMDLGDTPMFSMISMQFTASNLTHAIAMGNLEIISWEKTGSVGYGSIGSNVSDQVVIGFSATNPGAVIPEYTFTETTADFLGNTLTNVAIYETNAAIPATVGAIRLGDLEEIAFRNSTNDGNYTILSDDPTLSFNTWETIEFPDATIIDAGAADLQILSIDMSGDIVVNGFNIVDVGIINSNGANPADAGFLRMANTEILAWRDFGDTGNITLSVNASDQFEFNSILTVGNNVIKAVDTPVDGTDAANKTYVDNLVNGLVWKDAADIATTGDITLSGEQTIDGVLTSASRVLVKDQTLGEDNGVYTSGAGAWTRTTDADSDTELVNMSIFISLGTVNAGSSWTQTTDLPITVGTTVLVYAQIGAGSINPLTTKGDIFGYDTGSTRIPVGTDGQTLIANSAVALGVEWQTIGSPLISKGDLYTFTTVDARLPVGVTGQILSANAALSTGLEWIDDDSSPLTSKGDIFTFTTVNERIAVGSNGQVLSANAAQPTGLEWITLPVAGDVVGPAGATDNAIARYDTGTGKLIQNSGVTIDDNNRLLMSAAIILTAAGTVPAGTETYFREDASNLDINVASAQSIILQFGGGGNDYVFTSGNADFSGNTITNADFEGELTDATITVASGLGSGLTYGNGIKQTFNPSSANAGLNVGAQVDPDPSAPVNGDIYYNSTNDKFRAYENSVWVDMITAGGSQTPITSDIDYDGFDILDLSNIEFRNTTGAPAGSVTAIYKAASVLNLNADAGDAVSIRAGGIAFANFGNGAIPSLQMAASSIQQEIGTAAASTGFMSLIRDGNYYHVTGTTTITNITTAGWQSGSIIQLNFDGALTVTDAATGSGEIILADSANYVTVAGDVLTLVLDGTQWIEVSRSTITAGGGGDVTGPGSSTDNEIAIYDSTTGKIIQNNGSGAQPITIDDNANIAGIRSEQFVNSSVFPSPTVPYTQFGNSGTGTFDLENNVPTGSEHSWHINGTEEYNFTATEAKFSTNNIIQTTAYWQMQAMAAPASSGSALVGRLYQDLGNSNHLTISRNGVPVDLESGGGDVVGPASSTDNAIARYDLATGKLLQDSGILIGDLNELTDVSQIGLISGSTIPGAATNYIFIDAGGMLLNTLTGDTFDLTINQVSEYEASATAFTFKNGNNLIIESNSLDGYIDFEELTGTPALPAANGGRLYTKDVSTETHLFFINSSGEETDLTEHALQTPWQEDIEAATFDLNNLGNLNFSLTGATGLPAITEPYITWDDTLAPDAMRFNIPTGTEYALYINGVEEYTINATSLDMQFNQLTNVSFITLTSATAPTLRFNRSTASASTAGAGEIQFRSGNQIYGEILVSPTDIDAGDETATMALRVAQNSFEYDMITLIGSSAGPTFGTISFHQNKMASQINMGGNVLQEVLRMESDDANKATTGFLRMGNAELLAWRNNADSLNHSITFNASDQFVISVTSGTDYTFSESSLNMIGNALQNPSEIQDASGNAIIDFGTAGASAVNEITITNAITATSPIIAATGTDANVGMIFRAKGTGGILFEDDTGNREMLNLINLGATATNYVEITNSITGVGPTIAPQGQADIDLNLIAKGTGLINLNTTTDLLGNNLESVQNIVHDQSVITYNATLAFDFDLDQEQTLAVTGDLTTLTTSNRAAGKSKSIFITGDTVNRTLTFNASWRTNPATATVTITANTFGLLTFGSKGAAETDVFCAYAEFV